MTKIHSIPCAIEAITPLTENHFFGFYDICPWSPDDEVTLVLRYSETLDQQPDGSDLADLCIWNPASGEITKIDETRAWNFQQGTRSQWLDNDRIVFNDLEAGADFAKIVTRNGLSSKRLDRGVAAVSGSQGISPSFGRLGKYYTSYGYRGASSASIDRPIPDDDGLWTVDLDTGAAKLMFSLATLSQRAGISDGRTQFVSHPSYNPAGERIVFAHSVLGADHTIYTSLMAANQDGSDLKSVATEKISHYDWFNNDTLVIWARFSTAMSKLRKYDVPRYPLARPIVQIARRWQGLLRNSILSEGFHLVSVDDPAQRTRVAPAALVEDGHCCMHPHLELMVSDTYPDANNQLHLYLYSFDRDIRVDIRSFDHGVRFHDHALRCDLHPRWNRAGDRVSVDICEAGIRRMAIIDVRSALDALL